MKVAWLFNSKVVEFLVKNGANVDQRALTVVEEALKDTESEEEKSLEEIEKLLKEHLGKRG